MVEGNSPCVVRLGNRGALEFLSEDDIVNDVYGKELLCIGNGEGKLRFLKKLDVLYKGVPSMVEVVAEYQEVDVDGGDINIGIHSGTIYHSESMGPFLDKFMENRDKMDRAGIW